MHNAPAVSYPVGRSRFQAQVLALLSLAAVIVWTVWVAHSTVLSWHHAIAAVWMGVFYPLAWWCWARTTEGQLSWSGELWRWETATASVEVVPVLVMDAQIAGLLKLRRTDVAAHKWVWVEQRALSARWRALRRALVQRHIRVDASRQHEPEVSSNTLERVA